MKRWNDWIPCTKPISIGDGVRYKLHKHWGMNVWAGEGLFIYDNDKSGCLIDHDIAGNLIDKINPINSTCLKPTVVLQRIYYKGKKQISAVLSYPNGISAIPNYFWEIYPVNGGDVKRFCSEGHMEREVKKMLLKGGKR